MKENLEHRQKCDFIKLLFYYLFFFRCWFLSYHGNYDKKHEYYNTSLRIVFVRILSLHTDIN